jgi:ribosomal protein L11 methyltransferase
LGESKVWPALLIESASVDLELPDLLSSTLDEFSLVAVQDLADQPLPPGGLWDPTLPPPPEPPPGPLDWRVFFANARDRDAAATAIRRTYPSLTISKEDVPDEDWAARSQRELTVISAGTFVVAPPWAVPTDIPERSTLIVIEPSRGFGTGHHASTRLCLRALSDIDLRDQRVLDLGTGSGVLALAASLRGARQVVAIDVDPDAIDAARSSMALNPGASSIEWLVGDYRKRDAIPLGDSWQVILANLTGGMLIVSASRVRELLAPGGHLIVSGFDEGERADVEAALNLRNASMFVEDGWVGLLLST